MSKIIEDNLLKEVVPFKVSKVYLFDAKSGIEYGLAELKTTELDGKSDTVEVRAGQGNNIRYILDKPRTIKFNLEDVVVNENLNALRLGDAGLRNGVTTISGFHMPKLYVAETDGSDIVVILDDEPKVGEEVTFTNPLTGVQIDTSKIAQDSTNKKKFVITDVAIVSGTSVSVGGFKFTGKASDKYYHLVSTSSIPEVFAVVETPLIKTDMTHICDKQYILPRCKLDASVNEQASADPKEVSSKYVLTVLKPETSDYLGTVYFKFPTTIAVTPISDLAVTSTVATEADFVFTAPTDADNIEVQYKLSSDLNWSETNIGGVSGVRIATAVYETDTTSTVLGLTTGSVYDFRLVVEGGLFEGVSNIITSITVA